MKTTRYFEDQVLRKSRTFGGNGVSKLSPSRFGEVQADGRTRIWWKVDEVDGGRSRYLRVVTLDDGETVHNAFFDRDFREDSL